MQDVVSVSMSRSRDGLETYQRLVSVSDVCVSDLVSVSTQNVSGLVEGLGPFSSRRDVSCRRAQLNYNSPMKTSRPMPNALFRRSRLRYRMLGWILFNQ